MKMNNRVYLSHFRERVQTMENRTQETLNVKKQNIEHECNTQHRKANMEHEHRKLNMERKLTHNFEKRTQNTNDTQKPKQGTQNEHTT